MKRAFVATLNFTDAMIETYSDRLEELEEWVSVVLTSEDDFARLWNNRIRYITYQLEAGEETGRLHLQIYLETTDSMRVTTVANILKQYFPGSPSCKVFERLGTQAEAIAYANKEDTRIHGPFSWGTPVKVGRKQKDFRKHKDVLLDCISKGLTPREVWKCFPSVYMTHYRFIEHLVRAGLWGVSPYSDEEK